jgi:hypothetical protein
MIIIWGTKRKADLLGVVGDWCPDCARVRKFSVQKHYQVPHIYWIPLGRWQYIATSRTCWRCGVLYHCRAKDYVGFLPEAEAEELPAAEVARLTSLRRFEALEKNDGADSVSVLCPHCDLEFWPGETSRQDLRCPSCNRTV